MTRFILLSLLCCPPVFAAERVVDGHIYAASVTSGAAEFKLQGAGQYRHLGIWRVYSSALYLTKPEDAATILGNVPKRLEITYYRDISAKDCIEIGDKYLKKNLSRDQLAAIRDGVDAINLLYRDLKTGDRYVLEYQPGKGTTLTHNGTLLGTVPGESFGASYFAIWLGEKSPGEDLRKAMLGNP
jgi:hypothetical protein